MPKSRPISTIRKNFPIKVNYLDICKDDDQFYAKINKVNGGGRFVLQCLGEDLELLGICRGNLKNRKSIARGSLVLVSKRDFQPTKCDILYVYDQDEIAVLEKNGDIDGFYKITYDADIEFSNNDQSVLYQLSGKDPSDHSDIDDKWDVI